MNQSSGDGKSLLNERVLVLNHLWQAINVCSAKRAVSLLYQGEAQVVAGRDGRFETLDFDAWTEESRSGNGDGLFIHTVSLKLMLPKIVMLRWYDGLPPREVRFTRRNVYQRDHNRCQYCGKKFESKGLCLDHVVPVARGGATTWDNVVCSCLSCNARKGSRTLQEAGMKLVTRPRKPRWYTFAMLRNTDRVSESWRWFLDTHLWTGDFETES